MSNTVGADGKDSFEVEVGRLVLELANEWVTVQKEWEGRTHASGLLRNVFGALTLQVGVRASEMRERREDSSELGRLLKDWRKDLAEAVQAIERTS